MLSGKQVLLGTGVLLVWTYLKRRYDKSRHPPLPPCPPKDPIIGHVRSLPTSDQDLYFYELGQKYGGIVHLDVLGTMLIVVNKSAIATELLEKRGAIYSGRPWSPMPEILGINRFLVFMGYDDKWRAHRRILQKYLTKEKVQAAYNQELWQTCAKSLVTNLAKNTDRWTDCLVHFSTSLIIEYAYGHRIKDEQDYYLELASNFCNRVMPFVRPPEGALVSIFPIARYFPSWIPGNAIVGQAREASKDSAAFEDYPVEDVTKRMAEGTARPSFLVTHLEAYQNKTMDISIEEIKSLAGVLFAGGSETTSATLGVFMAAMIQHPEFQLKAQAEIDRVIEPGHLPEFSDRGKLPMVEAIVQEVFRWHPALPYGVPHVATEEDVYDGMYIPKGALVIPYQRGMAMDHEVYQDPFTFDPTRFLPAPEGRAEPHFSEGFGFGRRICVGKHLAEDVLWISMATMLAALSFQAPIGEDGKEYLPKIDIVQGPTCHVRPFKCRIEPRNESMKSLISDLATQADLGAM